MRTIAALLMFLAISTPAAAQTPQAKTIKQKLGDAGTAVFEFFKKPVHPSLQPIAPTAGKVTLGIGLSPKPWRNESRIKTLTARASVSNRKYWAVDGGFAWQQSNSWRFEPFARFRSMKQLNAFGLGNHSALGNQATFTLLERRVGAMGWKRPVPWLALGGRAEVLWPRTSSGQSTTLPSIEDRFPLTQQPGFQEATNFIHGEVFANLNYPSGTNERPRRGGDYRISAGSYHDMRGTGSSFQRFDVEGQERFKVFGPDRQLTLHALASISHTNAGQQVPFYFMDTLGGANNLRGFREDIIGSDQTSSTLRAFQDFRFRDANQLLLQAEFRQRVASYPVFVSIFSDAGMVSPRAKGLNIRDLHHGWGLSLSALRGNVMAFRFDFSLGGGEGKHYFLTPGKAFGF